LPALDAGRDRDVPDPPPLRRPPAARFAIRWGSTSDHLSVANLYRNTIFYVICN
jgi:hypothetical protein